MLAQDFAHRIHHWVKNGFPEHGDFGGMGLGATTSKVVGHPEYLNNPHEVRSFYFLNWYYFVMLWS